MKIIQFIIVTLLLMQVTSAHEAYSCRPHKWTSRIRLGPKLAVHSEHCTLTQNDRYMEICNIGADTLMVSFGGLPSVLVTSSGAVHKMDCRTPEQRQQQQQQQQQQQEQDTDRPGHGGGTIRGNN